MTGTTSIPWSRCNIVIIHPRKESKPTWTESTSDSDDIANQRIGISSPNESSHLLSHVPSRHVVATMQNPSVSVGIPIHGFFMLLCSFCTLSSLGVAFELWTGVSPVLKMFWKVSGTCIVTTFICLPKLRAILDGTITLPPKTELISCAFGYCLWNCTFIWVLDHTSVGHAYILNISHSLVLVVGKLFRRHPVAAQESIGTVIGILGGVVTALDHTVSRTKAIGPSLKGDIIAFLGAIGAAVYLTNAKTIRNQKDMDFMVFMWLHMCSVCLLLFPVLFLLDGSVSLSTDPNTGLFGWLNWSRFPIQLYLVGVCDFIGGMGYIRVLKYFEPIVVSIVMLLEPVLAVLLGIAVGVSNVPGIVTVIGSAVVILGTGLVIHSSTKPLTSHLPTDEMQYGSIASSTA